MKIIYDGDEILYQSCKSAEQESVFDDTHHLTSSFSDCVNIIQSKIDAVRSKFGNKSEITFAFSGQGTNFRKGIMPTYKEHRRDTRKPLGFARCREYLKEEFPFLEYPTLEADDAMGVHSEEFDVLVSSDKDMKTIPDILIYSPFHDRCTGPLLERMADFFFFLQTLMGDKTDGYPGCPKIGEKRATEYLESFGLFWDFQEVWDGIVKMYRRAGKTEEDALQNARVARILRPGEYNFTTGEVKWWTP